MYMSSKSGVESRNIRRHSPKQSIRSQPPRRDINPRNAFHTHNAYCFQPDIAPDLADGPSRTWTSDTRQPSGILGQHLAAITSPNGIPLQNPMRSQNATSTSFLPSTTIPAVLNKRSELQVLQPICGVSCRQNQHHELLSPRKSVTFPTLDDHCTTQSQTAAIHVTSGRKSRSDLYPPLSDPHQTIPRPRVFETRTIGETGRNSGRNHLALFAGGDGVPRTRYNLRILRGRTPSYLQKVQYYPESSAIIPGGLTLAEICKRYPRHIWGTCLRMFIAEGWTGEQIYKTLPTEFRDSRALQRPWNYIQQGFTREVKKMNEEDGIVVETVPKRKRSVEIDTQAENTADELESEGAVDELKDGSLDLFAPECSGLNLMSYEHPIMTEEQAGTACSHQCNSPATGTVSALFQENLHDQDKYFMILMDHNCPAARNECHQHRMARVHLARRRLCSLSGIEVDQAYPHDAVGLTQRLYQAVEVQLGYTPYNDAEGVLHL